MSSAEQTNHTAPAKRDHRQEVTNSIVKMLEDGVSPWQKPWKSAGMPFNPTTDKAYRGGNAVHLMAAGMSRGYEDPRWMTYKQAAENGWQVRKGEKGTHIEFWELKARPEEKREDPVAASADKTADESQRRWIHRVYTVFNAKQIDGVPTFERPQPSAFEVAQSGERILAKSGANIHHDQSDRAFYRPSTDSIHLPPKEAFQDAPGYYGTALHELAHWTGHPSRLNRPTLNESYKFGDLNYAKEELRAELASVFIAAELGVPHNPANHAAYVGSWIKALKEDKNEIFRAAQDASAATDFVLSLDRDVSRAQALEVGDSAAGDPAAVQAIRDQIGVLEGDRTQAGSSRDVLSASFAAAKSVTAEKLGDSARTFAAETQSGNYRGEIIGETELHVVQKLSPRSAVAHMKQLLEPAPKIGESVGIGYANNEASVKELRERSRSKELVR